MEMMLLILLSFRLCTADATSTSEGNSTCSVSAEVGETAILPVKVDLPQDSELLQPIISWKNEGGGFVHDYWYNKDNNEHQDERFKGRTSLFKEEIIKGNISLKISNVTKNDAGKYTCEVHIPHGDKSYKVSLCVLKISENIQDRDPTESPNTGLTPGQTAGIVIGVVLMVLPLIGVAVLFKKRREEHRMSYHGAPVDDQEMQTRRGGDPRAGSVPEDENSDGVPQ